MTRTTCLAALLSLLFTGVLFAQPKGFNYDEAKVPTFELPKLLQTQAGKPVTSSQEWSETRRPEVLAMLTGQMFGEAPPAIKASWTVVEHSDEALNGKAIRKQVKVSFTQTDEGPQMEILIYLPKQAAKPVPVFLGLNFQGNHTVHGDSAIHLTRNWVRKTDHSAGNRATEKGRGVSASRWQVEKILDRNYGIATIYYGDIDPDYDDGFQNGVHPLFYREGQSKPETHQWGSIAAWAWGLSRAMDYFESDGDIDAKRVAVLGHSRLGKTSLWAGATDPRFAIVISNNSGCGGAALSRRRFGETVARINTSFPHWFCDNFTQFNDREEKLPFDQHMLIALSAPRPVYVASAEEDRWADPRGEFSSLLHAQEVYRLYGLEGLGVKAMPKINSPAVGHCGYHIRSGRHDVTAYDWEQYLAFADRHFRRRDSSAQPRR